MKTLGKSFLAIFLCVLLLASMLPISAMAAEDSAEDETDPKKAAVEVVSEEDPDEENPDEEDPNEEEKPLAAKNKEQFETQLPEEGKKPDLPEAAAEPVTLSFVLTPEDAELTVYTKDEKREMKPGEDGLYRLLPGAYVYTAVCAGYISEEDVELIVEATGEQEEIHVTLSPAEPEEPTPESTAERKKAPMSKTPAEAAELTEKTVNERKSIPENTSSLTIEELMLLLGITSREEADAFIGDVEDAALDSSSPAEAGETPADGTEEEPGEPSGREELLTVTMRDGTVYELSLKNTQEGDELSKHLREELLAIAGGDAALLAARAGDAAALLAGGTGGVHVSSDLANFLENAVVSGATQNGAGAYVVEPDVEYSILLSFAENSSYQFDNGAVLTYQMPAGIKILTAQNGSLTINIVYKGRTYQVGGVFRLGTNGVLEIEFDENDPDFPRLEESTDVSFRFSYYAQFENNAGKIHFSDDVERQVVFDEPEPGQAYVKKTAVYDEAAGVFHYTITVTADGDVSDVHVVDTVIGNALVVDQNSVEISGAATDPTGGMSSTGFDYTFQSMKDGDIITIKYDAAVDFSKGNNKTGVITADQTRNTVSVDPEPGDPHTSEYSREITYKYTVKKDGAEAGTTSDGDKIIDWELEYNPLALAAVGGDTVTDRIAPVVTNIGPVYYMKYYGNGITVKKYDRSGNLVSSSLISYSDLTDHSEHTWTYTIPEADKTPYRYVITYQTIVDMEMVAGTGTGITLNNTANEDGGSIHVVPEDMIDVVKEAVSFDTKEITWNSTLTIPAGGLSMAQVTDYLPRLYRDEGNLFDLFKDGTLEITGLLEGESYTVAYSTGAVEIKFFKAEGVEGLRESANGRTVNVKLTSKVNQEWLEIGYEAGEDEKNKQNHTNTITFNGKSDTATVTFGKPGIVKSGETKDQKSFKYTLLISGLREEPFTITDKFDTSLMEVDTTGTGVEGWEWDHMRLFGGTQFSQIAGRIPVSYTDTADGIAITANAVPKQEDGHFYPYYRIVYYLKLKDGVDLEQLAIANGGEYDLVNKAIWADHETTYTYKVEYDFLNKELLNAGQLGGKNRTAQYKVTFNSSKATLNDGEPMEMTDVLSANLSLNYGTVQITTDPVGIAVPYSISGGPKGTTVATYIVPDSTKVVITYTAEVRGNGSQKIVNKVTVNGDEEDVDDTADYGAIDEGQGAIASFKIIKVDGYDANKKLSGVRFRVFAVNPDLSFDKDNLVKEIELETDTNGEIVLDGAEYLFYFDELYHVQEIEAPPDYGSPGFDYLVTLTKDMALVDYGHYIYYFSDEMQIKNWPLEGLVVEKQVDSYDARDKERYYTFRVSILDSSGNVDTSYNGKNGDDTFVNGAVEFQIKDGEQKMFWGFLKGTRYKVEELDAEGFATTVTYNIFDEHGNVTETRTDKGVSHSGELTQEDEVIVFKNTKAPGSLKIKKNVTVNGAATTTTAADGTYTFTITGPNEYSTTQTITITNGASNEVVVGDLVPGDYTVNEDVSKNPAGMALVGENGRTVAVTANNTEAIPTAEFTNNKALGSLKIKKNVTVNGAATTTTAADGTYTFTITGPNEYSTTQTITITNGASNEVVVGDLVPGDYTVNEDVSKNPAGMALVGENGRTVAVTANNTETVPTAEFTNNFSQPCEGEIIVRKVLNGRPWTYNDSFTFTISAREGTPMPPQTTITITRRDPDQTRSFGTIAFTQAGRYVYTVRELRGGDRHLRYDTREHTVTIEVVSDGHGNLVAQEGTQLIRTVTITNTYRPRSPGTGDNINTLRFFSAMMIASMLGLAVEGIRHKKSKK